MIEPMLQEGNKIDSQLVYIAVYQTADQQKKP